MTEAREKQLWLNLKAQRASRKGLLYHHHLSSSRPSPQLGRNKCAHSNPEVSRILPGIASLLNRRMGIEMQR